MIIRNTVYLFLGGIFANIAIFLNNLILARKLTSVDYATIVIIISITYIFTILADFGISNAATRKISMPKRKYSNVDFVTSAIRLSVLSSFVFSVPFFISMQIMKYTHPNYDIQKYFFLLIIWILSQTVINVGVGIYNGFQKMDKSLILYLCYEPLKFIASIILVLTNSLTLKTVVYFWSFTQFVSIVIYFIIIEINHKEAIKKIFIIKPNVDKSLLKSSLDYYAPYIAIFLIPFIINILVGTLSTSEDVALVAVAFPLTSLLALLLLPFSYVFMPYISSQTTIGERLQKIGYLLSKYLSIVCLFVVFFMMIIGKKLILFLYSEKFIASYPVFVLILIAIYADSFKIIADAYLKGSHAARYCNYAEIFRLLSVIILGIILIKMFQLKGAVAAIIISYFITNLLKLWWLKTYLSINLLKIYLFSMTLAGLFCGSVFSQNVYFIITLLLVFILYLIFSVKSSEIFYLANKGYRNGTSTPQKRI